MAKAEELELIDAIKAETQSQELGQVEFADPDDDGGMDEPQQQAAAPPVEEDDLADLDPSVAGSEDDTPVGNDETPQDFEDFLEDDEGEEEGIPEELIAHAKKYGMTDQQIAAFEDPEKLVAAITAIDTQALQVALQQQQYQAWQQQQAQAAMQQQQQQPTQQEQQQQEEEIKTVEIDPELVDPGTAEVLQEIQNNYVEQIRRTMQRVNEVQSQLMQSQQALQQMYAERQREAQEREVQSFDSALSSLPGIKEKVGDGSFLAMNVNSPEYAERYRLWQTQAMIRQQHAMAGRNISVEEAVKSAAMILYPDMVTKAVKNEFKKKISKRQRQFSGRPSARKTRKGSRAERALKAFEKWEAANGLLD